MIAIFQERARPTCLTLRAACAGFSVFLSIMALSGCAPGKPQFLMVQICLKDKNGLQEFTRVLQSIAHSQRKKFVDGSAETEKDLKSINALDQEGPFVNMGVEGEDGEGLTAGNLGLPGYQVAVGFGEGVDVPASRRFADFVVHRLEEHWHIFTVPAGKGAFPLKECGPARSGIATQILRRDSPAEKATP